MPKLTQKACDIRKTSSEGDQIIRDDEIRGFGLRITKGTKSFFVESRVRGKQTRVTIGRADLMSLEDARKKARQVLAEMTAGIDPHADKKRDKASSITLQEVLDVYLATKELRQSTKDVYRRIIQHAFKDWLNKPVSSISKDMVEFRHKEMINGKKRNGTSGKAYANGAFKTLQALINFANEKYEIDGVLPVPVNPVSRLNKTRAWYRVHPRTGVIPESKLKDFYQALHGIENETVRDYFLLLTFTGLRRQEGLKLKWSAVDLDAKTLKITRYLAKNHREHVLPLSNFLFDLLKRRHDANTTSEYVFPGRSNRGHLTDFKFSHLQLREKCWCRFLVHDLRRGFLTAAERLELPFYVLKRLANHSASPDTLTPYIVVSIERLREHMEKISQHFERLMGIGQAVEVGAESSQDDGVIELWRLAVGE